MAARIASEFPAAAGISEGRNRTDLDLEIDPRERAQLGQNGGNRR
jgi:hypothetical protein